MRRFASDESLPTLPAAFLAVGSALFVSFVWYLLTWSLPEGLGRADLASRLNPFALPAGAPEVVPVLRDPLFWANLVASNVLILGMPIAAIRLLHRGSTARLVLAYYGFVLALNLLFQARHLSPAYSAEHRTAYACDLAAGLVAAALGARLGTSLRWRLLERI